MRKSIITDLENYCYICGKPGAEKHHIFFGTGNRKLSDEYGLFVPLCPEHHRGTYGVHGKEGEEVNRNLKQIGQREFEKTHSRKEFIDLFGRSYL